MSISRHEDGDKTYMLSCRLNRSPCLPFISMQIDISLEDNLRQLTAHWAHHSLVNRKGRRAGSMHMCAVGSTLVVLLGPCKVEPDASLLANKTPQHAGHVVGPPGAHVCITVLPTTVQYSTVQ